MQNVLNQKHMTPFSFWNSLFSVFSFRGSRISEIKRKFEQRTDSEAIRQDWLMVGLDLTKSFDDLANEYKARK